MNGIIVLRKRLRYFYDIEIHRICQSIRMFFVYNYQLENTYDFEGRIHFKKKDQLLFGAPYYTEYHP